jgi:hypothetical protein
VVFQTCVIAFAASNFGRLRLRLRAKLLPGNACQAALALGWVGSMEIIGNVIREIGPEYWVALGAAVSILSLLVAGFSLIYVRRSAKASREQTKQQKQAAKDAAQPMLWVDIRGDDGSARPWCCSLETPGRALPAT